MENMNERIPVILQSDFYKQAHAEQYPEGITGLISYATARMSRMPQKDLAIFGIQAFVKRWLIKEFNETFFNRDFKDVEEYYKWVIGNTFPLQYVSIEKFKKLHELGYLPIEVGCLPEGTKVPIRNAFKLPEGQCQVPFLYIKNTHEDFAWLVEFLESLTSSEIWYPMCVANQALFYRDIVNHWYDVTGCDMSTAKSAIAEFGFRGGKGQEAATLASSAFLTSFNKTATIPAIIYNAEYYNEDIINGNVGAGMISTEHSVMCSNYAVDMEKYPILTKPFNKVSLHDIVRIEGSENEVYEVVGITPFEAEAGDNTDDGYVHRYVSDESTGLVLKDLGTVEDMFLMRLFTQIYPTGALSVVMDSYDYWHNLMTCGLVPHIKKAVMDRQGTVFFRGDSGDPVDIICGEQVPVFKSLEDRKNTRTIGDTTIYAEDEKCWYKFSKVDGKDHWQKYTEKPVEVKGTVEVLWDLFGGTVNDAGYKVLDSHVKAIYGDSITPVRAQEIYRRLAEKGFASSNVALGAGSFSMNCIETDEGKLYPFTRDSYGIAVKATWCKREDGREQQLFKNPKTDTGKFKKSQRGLVFVTTDKDGEIVAYDGFTTDTLPKDKENLLQPIFRNGEMVQETSLSEIRNRLHDGNF